MNRLSLDEISKLAVEARAGRPATVPDWVWAMPWAHEPYSTFLHLLAWRMQPELIVELGTDNGTSAAFLATATRGKVVSIDCDRSCSDRLRLLAQQRNLPNLVALHGDSVSDSTIAQLADLRSTIGLLYVDSDHTFEQVSKERAVYGHMMASGGVIAYDDVRFNEGMGRFWDDLDDAKVELPELHWTSFGATVIP